jgi:hypothetical protein
MTARMTIGRCVLIVLIAGAFACTPTRHPVPPKGGPVDEGPGSIATARKFLEGRWALESFQVFPPARQPITLKGQGVLTYDAYGNLQMEIRADDDSSDQLRAAGIEIKDNMISSGGRTILDMQHHTIAYVLDGVSMISAPVGPLALNRPRYWEVEANRLTLTTKDDAGTILSVGKWTRVQ